MRTSSDREQHPSPAAAAESAAEPAFSDDGVDLTLIRWMLAKTPLERLHALQTAVTSIVTLRNARLGA